MNKEDLIRHVTEKVEGLLQEKPSNFLVEVRIKPTNNFKVFIDGDNGVGIDELVKFNRTLYRQIEEEGLFPDGDFSLEVSSPGLDEPLKLHRQYKKNVGHNVEVITEDGQIFDGLLQEVNDDTAIIEETKGKTRPNSKAGLSKKIEIVKHTILLNTIKTTKIKVKF